MTETPFSEAAKIIEEKGWWNGSFSVGGSTGSCIWLAISDAIGVESRNDLPFLTAISVFVTDHFGIRELTELYNWNDSPGRTKEEVVAKLWDLHGAWLMDIGEEKKEVEFEPIAPPVEAPTPVETPSRELEPA